MGETIGIVLLWLFVINLGIAVGAGFYEARVVVPVWAQSPPQSLGSPESGLRFWAFVTTGPLTLLTLANLVAAWLAPEPARTWWLVAVVITITERMATLGYFVPTMIRLGRDQSGPGGGAAATFARWRTRNVVRNFASLVAWIAALRALTLAGG